MIKFAAGFMTAWYIQRNEAKIVKFIRNQHWIEKLELKNDIIKHDNPDVG